MALTLTPTTELEAVNLMLEHIGEQAVNTLTGTGVSDATNAQTLLHRVSREVQSRGLHCNTDEEYLLSRDVDGYLNIPTNVLKIDGFYKEDDLVRRGNKLYDRTNHTFVFTEDKYVNVVWFLAYTDLPECVRKYIAVKAAREFQNHFLGSEMLFKMTAKEEEEAYLEFFRNEVDSQDASIFDSYDMYKIIDRSNMTGRIRIL